jgi:sugar phosphate isomerase/epimerase
MHGDTRTVSKGERIAAYNDMIDSFECAGRIGATVMRVVGSSLRFRHEPHEPQLTRLAEMFRKAVRVAESHGIRVAVENHIDFNADEMRWLLDAVDSPYLDINFDTGNFLRLLDDPVKGMAKLANRVYATHIKDLRPCKGVPADEWYFFSSVPVGQGLVDNYRLVKMLAKAGFDGFQSTSPSSPLGRTPRNLPFYARLGFVEIRREALHPELATVVAEEADRGFGPDTRAVMGFCCGPPASRGQ